MRNPNGYGSVIKLSGNRRRPYMARVTVGWNDKGQPIYKALDYFAQREDALVCLAKYHDEPFNLDYRNITLENLWELFKDVKMPGMGSSLASTLRAAYGHCGPLQKKMYRSIKSFQMQKCIDGCESYATQNHVRNLFYHLDRFAFELDIISKRNSESLTVAPATPKEKNIFTDAEVQALWKRGDPGIDQTLFMLYTGMRVSEMLTVRCEDVHLDDGYLRGGVKTAAGKNRIIPIHPELVPVIQMNMGPTYLFEHQTNSANYSTVAVKAFRKMWEGMDLKHTPHECRHTFRSKLDSAGANKVCIDLIMGHKSQDVGERVYTHKTLEELTEAITLLNYW